MRWSCVSCNLGRKYCLDVPPSSIYSTPLCDIITYSDDLPDVLCFPFLFLFAFASFVSGSLPNTYTIDFGSHIIYLHIHILSLEQFQRSCARAQVVFDKEHGFVLFHVMGTPGIM